MHLTWTALALAHAGDDLPLDPAGRPVVAGRPRRRAPRRGARLQRPLVVGARALARRGAGARCGRAGRCARQRLARGAGRGPFRGDAVLAGGATPFSGLPERGKVAGAAAVVTLAGLSADRERSAEFFRRFAVLGDEVEQASGARAALVQAPSDGAVLTFSAWDTLRDAVTWAYHRPCTPRRSRDRRSTACSTAAVSCAARWSPAAGPSRAPTPWRAAPAPSSPARR